MIFGLGAQRWTLDILGIQYLHSQSRGDKTFLTLQVNRSTHVQWLGHRINRITVFLSSPISFRCYPPHRNIHSTTILVHRRTVHMHVKVIPRLDVSYLILTNQASVGHFACTKQWRSRRCTAQSRKFDNDDDDKKKPSPFQDSMPHGPSNNWIWVWIWVPGILVLFW